MSVLARAARTAAFALLAVLAACGDTGSGSSAPAAPPAAPAPTAPAAQAAPAAPAPSPSAASAPAASAVTSPAAAAPGDPAKGSVQYATLCASCHGPKGCGDGPLAASLNPKPAKHCDGNYMNPLTDEYLFRVVKQGGAAVGKSPMMAPWGGTLDDAQIRDVVAFVRTLAVPPYHPKS